MKCELCPKPATVNITWGMYPSGSRNNANLCESCSSELWDTCKSAVNRGEMHWLNQAVKQEEMCSVKG